MSDQEAIKRAATDLSMTFKMLSDLKKQIKEANSKVKQTTEWKHLKELKLEFKNLNDGLREGAKQLCHEVTGKAPVDED